MNKPHSNSKLKSLLRSHAIPPTSKRLTIAARLLARHQHLTADQLHKQLKENSSVICKATVYNTLGLFVKNGLIGEINVDGNQTYYDSNVAPHQHFYNIDTGELTDIPSTSALDKTNCLYTDQLQLPEGTVLERFEVVIKIRNNKA